MSINFQRLALAWVTLAWFLFGPSPALRQDSPKDRSSASRWVTAFEPTRFELQMPDMPSRVVSLNTTEGTFMSVDVSPDGETLIFDLLGDIYLLPGDGGEALPLTRGRAWDRAPRFSPDGKSVYFVSDRKGFNNIWRLTRSDGSLQQVTASKSDVMGTPNWSHDGAHLLAGVRDTSNEGWDVVLQLIDPTVGDMSPLEAPNGPAFDWATRTSLRPTVKIFSGVQSADDQVYFSQKHFDSELGRTVVRLYTLDLKTQTRETMTPLDALYSDYKPQLSHNGNLLAYFRQYSDRNTEVRVLDRTTGHETVLCELTDADDASYSPSQESRPNYAFTPDDQHMVFWHGGKFHRLNLTDRSSEVIPFRVMIEREVWERAIPTAKHSTEPSEAAIVRWPSVSRDGQTMAFAAIGYIWLMDMKTRGIQRLTRSNDFEYMPALSPDGKSVAYVSFTQSGNNYGSGRLMVAAVDGGAPRELLASPNETFMLPNWSADGQKLAVIREVESPDDITAAFGWTASASGEFHEVAPAPASDDWSSAHVYARFAGFDKAGQNLLLSFPTSRTETILLTADLDGNAQRTLAIGSSDIGGIAPAPDLKNLALTRRDGTVWIVPFDAQAESLVVSTLAPKARRVSGSDGYYVVWNGSHQVTWSFGPDVYRYVLDGKSPEVLNVRVIDQIKIIDQRRNPSQPIAFRGARLLTMSNSTGSDRVIESGTIVLYGKRISAVGPVSEIEIPSDALVIDVNGRTIMPGLVDSHYHRIGGSGAMGMSAFKIPNPAFSDRSAIAYGVTTAWEPGGVQDDGAPATVDLQEAGRILGPRWSHSASGNTGYPWEHVTTYARAFAAVQGRQTLGVDVLKEYNMSTRLQRQWLSAAAHEMKLGIVSHIESFDGMMTRVVDGYTGGDHPYIPMPFFKDVRELLRQTGYIWTPNIVITSGSIAASDDLKRYYWRELIEKRPWELDKLAAMTSADYVDSIVNSRPSVSYQTHRGSRVARQAAAAASDGVHIGVSAHSRPSSRLHREMWYLWKGGMPTEDVLRAATMSNAEKLGLQEEIGSLEPGKIADFLVLDANPLDDILKTLSLRYTVQGGVVYDSDTALPADLSGMQETGIAAE